MCQMICCFLGEHFEKERKCLITDCTLDQVSMALSATSSFSVQRVGQNFNGKSLFVFSLMYRSLLASESTKSFDIACNTYKLSIKHKKQSTNYYKS